MTPEEKARLEKENAELKARLAASDSEASKRAAAERHTAHVSFADGLIAAGQLPPAHKDVAVATLDFMGNAEGVLEFGEGDAKQPLADGFRAFLQALPVAPEFAEEQATKDRAAGASGVVSFAAPRGYHVDGDSAALHAQALAYQKANPGTTYVSAVAAVQQP